MSGPPLLCRAPKPLHFWCFAADLVVLTHLLHLAMQGPNLDARHLSRPCTPAQAELVLPNPRTVRFIHLERVATSSFRRTRLLLTTPHTHTLRVRAPLHHCTTAPQPRIFSPNSHNKHHNNKTQCSLSQRGRQRSCILTCAVLCARAGGIVIKHSL